MHSKWFQMACVILSWHSWRIPINSDMSAFDMPSRHILHHIRRCDLVLRRAKITLRMNDSARKSWQYSKTTRMVESGGWNTRKRGRHGKKVAERRGDRATDIEGTISWGDWQKRENKNVENSKKRGKCRTSRRTIRINNAWRIVCTLAASYSDFVLVSNFNTTNSSKPYKI